MPHSDLPPAVISPARDLASDELWALSLERSRRRRALAAERHLPRPRRGEGHRRRRQRRAARLARPGARVGDLAAHGRAIARRPVDAATAPRRRLDRQARRRQRHGREGAARARRHGRPHLRSADAARRQGLPGAREPAAHGPHRRPHVDRAVPRTDRRRRRRGRSAGRAPTPPAAPRPSPRPRPPASAYHPQRHHPQPRHPQPHHPQRHHPQPTPPHTGAPRGSCGGTIFAPLRGKTASGFGDGRNHAGVDISAPVGTPVLAAACGTVTLAGRPERLRQDHLHPPHDVVLDVLRAPVVVRRRARRAGRRRAAHRARRHDRAHVGRAPAFRDARRRPPAQPRPVPADGVTSAPGAPTSAATPHPDAHRSRATHSRTIPGAAARITTG